MDAQAKQLLYIVAIIFIIATLGTLDSYIKLGKEQNMMEACTAACDNNVESFQLDWTHDPICICK